MKSNVLSLTFSLITCVFFFTACEKDNAITTTDQKSTEKKATEKFKVVDGVLHFLDQENYRKDAYEVMNLPEPEFREWERSIGFKSLRSWIWEANDVLDEVKDEAQLQEWKREYGDIVKIENNHVLPIIDDDLAKAFSNRDREFWIGGIYAKAYPEKTIYIQDGDISRLEEAREMNQSDLDKKIVIDLNEGKTITQRSGCPSYVETWREYSGKGVMYRFEIKKKNSAISGYRYSEIKIGAYAKKRNIFNNWKDDTAKELGWEECTYQVEGNTGFTYFVGEHPYGSGSTEVHATEQITDLNDDVPESSYVLPTFDFKKGRATSIKLDNGTRYAIQCCGFPSGACPDADD